MQDVGDGGLAGWRIYVDLNGNSVFDIGEPSDLSAADGNYTISGVNPGSRTVREVGQAGWTCSFPNPGAPSGGVVSSTNCSYTVTVTSGSAATGRDFGNWTTGTISGTKWEDHNANGVQDVGDGGLAGWRIYVDLNGNSVFDIGEPSDLSAANGDYTISGVNPGSRTVREVGQAGWTCSFPNPGAPSGGVVSSTNCSYTVTVTSGSAATGRDFGNWTTGTISGTKWEDHNANGVQDVGDGGLAGWRIYVDLNGNSVFDIGEPSDLSAADGDYTISGVNPGSRTVREVGQAGWTCSFPNPGAPSGGVVSSTNCSYTVTVTSGSAATGRDFGNWTTGTISGTKWEDHNANGVQDVGDGGLAGWRIYVDLNGNSVFDIGEPSDLSAADGDYTISGVNPGSRTVREVGQAGWTCSFPNPGAPSGGVVSSTNCSYTVTVTSGSAATGRDFGNWTTGTISGTKWEDHNANGVQDVGDGGLAGWRIYVDLNGNSVFDIGEPSDLSAANGDYTISGVNPGSRTVREVGQAGWTCSFPNPGAPSGGVVSSTNCSYTVTVTSGSAATGRDFGNWTTGTISGTKWEDHNANGVQDVGDGGLAGWRIYVDLNGNSVFDIGEPSDLSAADGDYTISGVNPGSRTVREVGQAGWTCSFPNPGAPSGGVVSSTNCSYTVTVTSGSAATGRDFGNWTTGTISGTKWEDHNANGVQDVGDGGLAGWRIYVDLNGNSVFDIGEPSDLSAANGDYTISGVNPGSRTVREVGQAGWTCSFPNPGAPSGGVVSSTNCSYTVTVTSGSAATGRDFGNWTTGTISGTKWEDHNANGVQDVGDGGLAGWTIRAYNSLGNIAASAMTAADGAYSLTLQPGKYRICESASPTGRSPTRPAPCAPGSAAWTPAATGDRHLELGHARQGLRQLHDRDRVRPQVRGPQRRRDRQRRDRPGPQRLDDQRLHRQRHAGGRVTSTSSGALGAYSLTLQPGKYLICESSQPAWTESKPTGTDCTGLTGIEAAGHKRDRHSVGDLARAATSATRRAGRSGRKWEDLNADGLQGGTTRASAGWTIRAYTDWATRRSS